MSFFFLLIPFSLANFSHLVSGRGPGGLRRRGSTVVGSGSLATMLSSTRSVGSSQMALTKSWVFSRVSAVRYSSLLSLKTMELVKNQYSSLKTAAYLNSRSSKSLGSVISRLPTSSRHSKCFSTVIGLYLSNSFWCLARTSLTTSIFRELAYKQQNSIPRADYCDHALDLTNRLKNTK